MDAVQNLITNTKNAVEQFENSIFKNSKVKYIVVKTVTNYISTQIEDIEDEIFKRKDDQQFLLASTRQLQSMIDAIQQYSNMFRDNDKVSISIDENGNIVSVPNDYIVEPEPRSYIDAIPRMYQGEDIKLTPQNGVTPLNEKDDISRYLDITAIENYLGSGSNGMKL